VWECKADRSRAKGKTPAIGLGLISNPKAHKTGFAKAEQAASQARSASTRVVTQLPTIPSDDRAERRLLVAHQFAPTKSIRGRTYGGPYYEARCRHMSGQYIGGMVAIHTGSVRQEDAGFLGSRLALHDTGPTFADGSSLGRRRRGERRTP
jgi:hypothetical protein